MMDCRTCNIINKITKENKVMKKKVLLFMITVVLGTNGCGKNENSISNPVEIESKIETEEAITEIEEDTETETIIETEENTQESVVEELESETEEVIVIEPFGESDFIVTGDNSVVAQTEDGSVISKFEVNGWEYAYQTFVEGDSFTTNRNISFPISKEEILKVYGDVTVQNVDLSNDNIYSYGKSEGGTDVLILENAKDFIEYTYNVYGMRFYFDEENNLLLVAYYKNYNMLQSSNISQSNNESYVTKIESESAPALTNPNTGEPLQPGDSGVTNGFEWIYDGGSTGKF